MCAPAAARKFFNRDEINCRTTYTAVWILFGWELEALRERHIRTAFGNVMCMSNSRADTNRARKIRLGAEIVDAKNMHGWS